MPHSADSALVEIGRRIRQARETAGLTQEDVAYDAGINLSYYGKLERGLNNPTAATLLRVAAVIGIDPGEIVAGLAAEGLPVRATTARRGPRRTAG